MSAGGSMCQVNLGAFMRLCIPLEVLEAASVRVAREQARCDIGIWHLSDHVDDVAFPGLARRLDRLRAASKQRVEQRLAA